MSFEGKYNIKSPAVKRLMREACELQDPAEQYWAHPLEDNLFEWHFTVRGPPGTDFDGGVYHGRIILPAEYPMKPPNIILLTPNGRFEVNKKICLSISGHHPETWQPSWSIRTALLAFEAFMPTSGDGTIGSLNYTSDERKSLAKMSRKWSCPQCGEILSQLAPPSEIASPSKLSTEESEMISQISLKGEEESQISQNLFNNVEDNDGLRPRVAEHNDASLIGSMVQENNPEDINGSNQGNTLILVVLVAIAMLLYRRMFLLE